MKDYMFIVIFELKSAVDMKARQIFFPTKFMVNKNHNREFNVSDTVLLIDVNFWWKDRMKYIIKNTIIEKFG